MIQKAKMRFRLQQQGSFAENIDFENIKPNDEAGMRKALASSLLKSTNSEQDALDPALYVSEKPQPMRGWVPPDDAAVPLHWFICPPDNDVSYRLAQLWGWRTNLERAILKADEDKVKSIANEHPIEDLREYCEIRTLLQKMAQNGMKQSCQLLIEYCGVSVEGVQASYVTEEWREMQKDSGDGGGGRTPLMIAAHMGQYEACECLLEHHASVDAIDWNISSIALHFAIFGGHKDVVKLLCKHGSKISLENRGGQDSIDLAECFMQPEQMAVSGSSEKQMRSILEILREYDNRCSYCRDRPAVLKECPCHKERYYNNECQRARWKDHKKLHNKIVAK